MNKIVANFAKNKYEEIRFQIKEYKGKDLIDIRMWTDVKGAEEKIPTTRGVSINISHFRDLKKAVFEVERALVNANLLAPENPSEDTRPANG